MEGDQVAKLIVRAHARGSFSYRDFDPLDPSDLCAELFVLREVAYQATFELLQVKSARAHAVLVAAAVARSGEQVSAAASDAADLYNKLSSCALGVKPRGWSSFKEVANDLVRWEAAFGALDSEKVQRQLAAMEAELGTSAKAGWQRMI